MGLILGKLMEESLSQSMILLDNNWLRFFESSSPSASAHGRKVCNRIRYPSR